MSRVLATIAAAVAAGAFLSGCAASDEPIATIVTPTPTGPYLGTQLAKPIPKPDVTLTDTSGRPFNVARGTEGKIVVLYIGYTNCPDVCPTTMADLSIAMGDLSRKDARKVDVVMITSDPGRDTPQVLKKWLASFSYDAIGLTGPFPKIRQAAQDVGVFVDRPVKNEDGSITVDHGAQVLVFGQDGTSDLIFTSGFAPEDVAHDLQVLIQGGES